MRLSKTASIVAALALGVTGALTFSQSTADAASVVTVTAPRYARLYTSTGQLVQNRALAYNIPWKVGKIIQIDGEPYYQVATNEYLKASDGSLNYNANQVLHGIVVGNASIYNDQTHSIESRILPNGSEWTIGKTVRNSNGDIYAQVSSHEYINANQVLFDAPPQNTIEISDFGQIDPNANQNNNTNTDSSVPSTQAVQQAFLTSINNERASRGIAPLTMDNSLNQTAMTRAQEIDSVFAHVRPNGSPCWSAFPGGSNNMEENIAASSTYLFGNSATKFADNIMKSFRAENFTPSHYTNVMSTDVTKVGIGVYYDANKQWMYVAEDFAS